MLRTALGPAIARYLEDPDIVEVMLSPDGLRAFDDGRQVFIGFPTGISQGELPPLWVIGAEGDGQLVNYRVKGSYMIVDRLFAAAELKFGEKRQLTVRIVRTDGRPTS
jgi:type IV secretory pathway VirB9-like protein